MIMCVPVMMGKVEATTEHTDKIKHHRKYKEVIVKESGRF